MSLNLFNSIQLTGPRSNNFDLGHDVKLSFNMGELVPVLCAECVPGDRIRISGQSMLRFAPLVAPVMHRADVTMHYFFVPSRLLWDGWEDFITNQPGAPAFPYLNVQDGEYTRLHDYLGIPTPPPGSSQIERVSALPFSAYQMVFNEYYRDQNLMPSVGFELAPGDNSNNGDIIQLRNRSWKHDYFTSALPWAQKGASVDLPLGSVELKPDWDAGNVPSFVNNVGTGTTGVLSGAGNSITASTTSGQQAYDPNGSLEVQPTTINDLRRAMKLQEWLERMARGGSRYIEAILAHFGVKSSDARLQRPEYIVGVKSPVQISEVLNMTGTDQAAQGTMAGHGISVSSGKYGKYFCEEHGYLLGIMSVMPEPAYQQGIPKMFLKTDDPFQFFWPAFANIGEQPIENRELYAFGTGGRETFGYTPRYAEYKFMSSRVAGDFRTSLDFWHMGRKFATQPALNAQFLTMNSPEVDRIFAVTDSDAQKLWAHVYNDLKMRRPMPKFGTPSF